MAVLLVVSSSRSGGTRALVDALVAGAREAAELAEGEGGEAVEVRDLEALDAGPDAVLAADAVVIATPTHFGAVAGLVKDFLERVYDPCLEQTRGRPWALVAKGRTDADGAVRDVQRIVTGLAWREVSPPVVVVGDVDDAAREAAAELGRTMAGGLSLDLW